MKIIKLFLILSILFINRSVFPHGIDMSDNGTSSYKFVNNFITYGSQTFAMSEEEILNTEKQRTEISKQNFKSYECDRFKIGDKVTYSIYWLIYRKSDFVGIVTRIDPKPTTEYIHWITVRRISGKGEGGTYSEQFLTNLK